MIQIRNQVDDTQFSQLSKQAYEMNGVVSFQRNLQRPQLLMVIYDAAVVRAKQILDLVRGQGHNASLIGI